MYTTIVVALVLSLSSLSAAKNGKPPPPPPKPALTSKCCSAEKLVESQSKDGNCKLTAAIASICTKAKSCDDHKRNDVQSLTHQLKNIVKTAPHSKHQILKQCIAEILAKNGKQQRTVPKEIKIEGWGTVGDLIECGQSKALDLCGSQHHRPEHHQRKPDHQRPKPGHQNHKPGHQRPNHGHQHPNHGHQHPNHGHQHPNHHHRFGSTTSTPSTTTSSALCPERSGLSSIIFADSFKPSYSYVGFNGEGFTMPFRANCSCLGAHTKYYYSPATGASAQESYGVKEDIMSVKSTLCPDFCACSETGNCYVGTSFASVYLNSYCEGTEGTNCTALLAINCELNAMDTQGLKVFGTTDQIVITCAVVNSARKYSEGIGSQYIPIISFGCNGCDELRSIQC